jgi:hypothetical protein
MKGLARARAFNSENREAPIRGRHRARNNTQYTIHRFIERVERNIIISRRIKENGTARKAVYFATPRYTRR